MKKRKRIPVDFTTGSMMSSNQEGIVADPFGMYTGVPLEATEIPVQDADDL